MNIIVKGILHIVNIGDCCKTQALMSKNNEESIIEIKEVDD
jgi:hypothetical protein